MAAAKLAHGSIAACAALILLAGCASTPAPASPSAPTPPAPAAPTPAPAAPSPVSQPAPSAPAITPPAPAPANALDAYLDRLRQQSCPKGVKALPPAPIDLSVKPISLARLHSGMTRVGVLDFVAGYELDSPDARFGGLSGLDRLEDGRLLAVSDQGDFVWLDLAKDGVTPIAASIGTMLSRAGAPFADKADGDAEGLAVQDGLALVSFERAHRVLAYNLQDCTAAARGIDLSADPASPALPVAFSRAGLAVTDNAGAEPLAVSPDWIVFTGLETQADGAGPVSARAIESPPAFDLRIGEGAPDFVGLDLLPVAGSEMALRGFSLHRAFSSMTGLSIRLVETRFERADLRVAGRQTDRSQIRYRAAASRTLANLGMLLNIDNFEGIAAQDLGKGVFRLFILSDNNFSDRQRTLLLVFDLKP